MADTVTKKAAIRAIVRTCVRTFAETFAARHIAEADNAQGTIRMKINNVFIAALGPEIQYYSALARSLDSAMGNMLERMAIEIAELSYTVTQHVEGHLYKEQTDFIAELLEQYKRHARTPRKSDYDCLSKMKGEALRRRHESDYYLIDSQGNHYLIELKIGGDLDNKKARSEKEALLEQYCILANNLGNADKIKILFATAYNRYGEGREWSQGRVRQFFADEELCISAAFWNLVTDMPDGFDIVLDEYRKCAHYITAALDQIKAEYLP